MADNRSAFVLQQVRTALDANALFTLHSVHRPNFTSTVNAYPYIVSQRTGETLEDGSGDSTGVVTVGILFDSKVASDTQSVGIGTTRYGDIVQACEDALADWESSISQSKPSDVHTGGLFKTVITSVRLIGWDGHYDTGGNTVTVGCQLEVSYYHIAL